MALFIASATNILVPKYGGKIIDIVSRDLRTEEEKADAFNTIKNTIVEILLIILIGSFATVLRGWWFASSSERVVARLRKDLFRHLINQEIEFFDVTRTGEILSGLSEETNY